ncbi:hypothetical protein SUGI_0823100 [Cryptomeria japonica]|uniref:putative lysine-specific demethylase JMJ16 n=1 Tax=Cryptomeria japonica TaxID=3369 RepID=UPI002414A437|nr:putative lysine-specific demethylase JMJ16 [Cryptomeria japonica]XP_057849033.2 putative lysine-specific demethylase JMJ16 [Cryptomeria japonica]XP_057849034.2 putative lysine-specific demethylase JMJ16 [Cryptomeria japonica]XP_057849035.2 putative lysine-specific demethylase JMJ16 [Cryptomeria japonica]GLJ40150.1 hypothetical protein SUGI_0823100 [Cryptomeria japonica]
MGSGYFEAGTNEDEKHRLVDPASCSPQVSFTLKRARSDANANSGTCPPQQSQTHADCSSGDEVKFTRALRRRPWINYGKFDMSSDDDSDCQQSFQARSSKTNLPKGVIRGCSRCSDCQKVTARWHPEDGCRPVIDEAPVFYPNEEEFKDTLKYIASIRALAEPHGICRIVPPPSWKPPCPLRDTDKWKSAKFPTRVQEIHKLQIRKSVSKKFRNANGGRRKRRRNSRRGRSCGRGQQCHTGADGELLVSDEESRFGFDSGSEFTLEAYERYANEFKEQYFGIREMNGNLDSTVLGESKTKWEPSVENIEGEYWRVIEKPTDQIEVLYGADVETGTFGSGFPKSTSGTQSSDADPYVESGWNLNNFARLPGSVLSYEGGDISGVLVPWLYLGMCFSSFCWHVEDHHFYSLNYMHWGAPKVWYGVPGSAAVQLEQAMRKHLPHLFDEQPDLLHKLVTQLSPTVLRVEGVPVYRSIQNSGEFVLTFPRAYHAGFNCGFNCAEAVNVAPIDWLPHGQSAVELYRDQCRKTSVSHDKLLLGASREAVRSLWELLILRKGNLSNSDWQSFCGEDGILTKAIKTRVEMERARRVYLANPARARKMDRNFDAIKERECLSCYYDLHLSAVGCECCPDRFACLEHAKQMCKCAWDRRFFLYRYDATELDTLVEALGGKLNAIYRWATVDLGLSLSSCVGYPNLQSGFQLTAESLYVNSTQSKMDTNSLLESKTPFISMLNLASGSNAGKIISSAMQHQNNKLTGSAALVGDIDCPREKHESKMPLGFTGKDTLLARAPQTNAEDVMLSSAVQHQDSKSAGLTSAMVDENHSTEAKTKSENPMELTLRDKIPDINKPFSFEENDLFNKPELILQARTISNEDTPCNFFSCKSDNSKIPFSCESKIEGNCSSYSKQWPFINAKDENTHYDQLNGPTSKSHMKFVASFNGIRATDNQGQYEPEASLRGQGSTSLNDVECILLSDDEEGTEKSIVMEKRAKVMQDHLSAGIPENAISSGRAAVRNLATEKVSYRAIHDEFETIGQTNEGNKISMLGMEQGVENIKECLRDESHAKQFDLIRETDFSDKSSKRSHASKLLPLLDNSLIQMGAPNKFHTAQGLLCEGSDIHPRYPIKSKVTERIAVSGNIHPIQQYTSTAAGNNDMNAVSGFDFSWNHMTNERKVQSFLVSSSSDAAANSTKIIQNKGPRIARVVRAQKCSYEVEVMDLGVMRPFKSWYNSQVIFPKGFKSRVRFHSVLDPTQMCNYISEVLDAGLVGPLFKVIVEGRPTEVFIHVTVDKCWELVQERLNQEIRRQRSLGKQNLPPLQPPGSLNGLEMFGFASPSIIQAIEDLDRDHKCLEYWATQSTRGIKTYPSEKTDVTEERNKGFNSGIGKDCSPVVLKNLLGTINNYHETSTDNQYQGQLETQNLVSTEKVHTVLKGLFKKASPDELWTLHKVLSSQSWNSNWKAAFTALVEELQNL